MSDKDISPEEPEEIDVSEEYVSPLASGEVVEETDEEDFDFGEDDTELKSEDSVLEDDEEDNTFVSDFPKDDESDEDDFDFESDSTEIAEIELGDDELEVADEPTELTIEAATELTEHIRSTADVLYVLVARAHAGKAHLALGYTNFAAYVKEEFNISRSRAYQFLAQANVIAEIESATPEGTQFTLTEAAARDLKNYVEELSPEIREKTEGLDPNEAGQVVEDIVSEYRDKLKQSETDSSEEEDLDFNFDLEDIQYDAPDFGDGESTGGGSEFDGMDDFDNLDEFDGDTSLSGSNINIDDPSVFREKLENVYAFYTALTSLEKMPDVEEIISSIQDARKPHINASLPKAKEWLDKMHSVWFEQNPISTDDEFEASEESDEFDFSDELEDNPEISEELEVPESLDESSEEESNIEDDFDLDEEEVVRE